jgi:cobalt-zinc-cadmium efflux system membrane fusion protein
MTERASTFFKIGVGALCAGLGIGLAVLAVPTLATWRKAAASTAEGKAAGRAEAEAPKVSRPAADLLDVPPDVFRALGGKTAVASQPTRPRNLPPLLGTLAIDNERLSRVHALFGGEVVAVGTPDDQEVTEFTPSSVATRALRRGDRVRKGQLLAVIWSKDLGNLKSALLTAQSQLRLDRENLKRLEGLLPKGATTERTVNESRTKVEQDNAAVRTAVNALYASRVPDKEIATILKEVDALVNSPGDPSDKEKRQWARVEVRSVLDGEIVEKNVNVGDVVPDNTFDVFKIADLSQLAVVANAYEEYLPALRLLPKPGPWAVRLTSQPDALPRPGTLESIGAIIDPNQHTAVVHGHVDNANGDLTAGMSVTATVELPPPADEVEVPIGALVEDGKESVLFVQPDPDQLRFERRRVAVARRFADVAYLRLNPPAPLRAVKPDERVLAAGAVLLKDAMDDLPVK